MIISVGSPPIFNQSREKGNPMIGQVLKRVRAIYGYKASDFSHLLDISPSYLSEIENGKKEPSLELLRRYSGITGIKLSSLMLLAESYEEAEKKGGGAKMIRGMMMKLINEMSSNVEEMV